jgi:biotin carboxyl carrier protein
MKYVVDVRGRKAAVSVEPRPDGRWTVAIDGGPARVVEARALGAAEWLLRDEAGARSVGVHLDGDRLTAQVRGHGVSGTVEDPRSAAMHAADAGAAGALKTPMPGAVARVLVKPGDPVTKGQVLVVVEAMKMENEFRAPCDGVVADVGVKAGTTVEAGALLVTVTPGGAA